MGKIDFRNHEWCITFFLTCNPPKIVEYSDNFISVYAFSIWTYIYAYTYECSICCNSFRPKVIYHFGLIMMSQIVVFLFTWIFFKKNTWKQLFWEHPVSFSISSAYDLVVGSIESVETAKWNSLIETKSSKLN